MDENLIRAAQEGNVDELYASIQIDRHVLRQIDEMEFVDTPLHIAAAQGCIDFAMEVMNLKPSFARKLKQQGFSPIHLAVEKGHKELVLLLIEIDKDLVRVKGKKGETPLHYAICREHNLDLLAKFMETCPECIQDMTTIKQTALHVAVRNNELKALELLCKMLRKTDFCRNVVNQKDKNGNTALHIAARDNRCKILKLLLECKADKHATNHTGLTALDIAKQLDNRESLSILDGFFIPGVSTFIYKLQRQILKYVQKASAVIFQDMDNISSEDRSALLVILGLLLTATYQASLSPPGGIWQGDSSSNSIVTNDKNLPGQSVMDEISFLYFYIPTSALFIVTFFLTLALLKPYPHGFKTFLQVLLAFLAVCFCEAIIWVAPSNAAVQVINLFSLLVFILMMFMCIAYRVSKVSLLILGYWLLHSADLVEGLVRTTVVGFGLIFVLYDHKFWKGTALVVGYCFIIVVYEQDYIIQPYIVLGCWLLFSLCRFCIKKYNDRCNVA